MYKTFLQRLVILNSRQVYASLLFGAGYRTSGVCQPLGLLGTQLSKCIPDFYVAGHKLHQAYVGLLHDGHTVYQAYASLVLGGAHW